MSKNIALIQRLRRFSSDSFNSRYIKHNLEEPDYVYILIVGGGLVGWSVAFWLRYISKTTVTLVERDQTYSLTSTLRGFGGLRHQYFVPEKINMSMFSFDFLRNINDYLQVHDKHKIDVNFAPHGHLMLATEEYSEKLIDNFHLQQALDVSSQYLEKQEISDRWPWLHTEDIFGGIMGLDYEGWLDSGRLLKALQEKAHYLGVNYVIGEVERLETYDDHQIFSSPAHYPERNPVMFNPLRYAHINTNSGTKEKITFSIVINCAGCWSKQLMERSDIDTSNFPIEKVLQHVFVVRPTEQYCLETGKILSPGIDSPFLLDTSGLNMQRIGLSGNFLVFKDTTHEDIINRNDNFKMLQNSDNTTIQALYNEKIRDDLIKRIPSMKNAQVIGGWSCLDDFNTYDQSPIIGMHPDQPKMFLACGTNNQTVAHSIAIGRAMSELIFYNMYRTVDLSCFSPHRLLLDLPVVDNKVRN